MVSIPHHTASSERIDRSLLDGGILDAPTQPDFSSCQVRAIHQLYNKIWAFP
jgi:hypothetical protein